MHKESNSLGAPYGGIIGDKDASENIYRSWGLENLHSKVHSFTEYLTPSCPAAVKDLRVIVSAACSLQIIRFFLYQLRCIPSGFAGKPKLLALRWSISPWIQGFLFYTCI